MSTAYVRVGYRNVLCDRVTIEKWFPGLATLLHCHNYIDTEPLAAQLKLRLTGHTSVPIRSHHIFEALEDLIKVVGGSGFGYHWVLKDGRVEEILERFLRDERPSRDYRGLYRSRNQFLILCVVASCTQSDFLAAALGSFIEGKACHIIEYEESTHLPEWCLGLCELRDLIAAYEIQRLVERMSDVSGDFRDQWGVLPYYDHYPPEPRLNHHRRRPVLALPRIPGWDPRAVRRMRSLDDVRVGRRLRTAWPSPTISPARLGLDGYLDDADAIQYQQLLQAVQLEEVKERIKQLEYFRGP